MYDQEPARQGPPCADLHLAIGLIRNLDRSSLKVDLRQPSSKAC